MNVSAVCTASQNPHTCQRSTNGNQGTQCHFIEQQCCGVVTTKKIGESALPARVQWSVDILKEEHLSRNREQGVFDRSFFPCNQLPMREQRQCKRRMQPSKNAHLVERALDTGRTDKPVLRSPSPASNGPDGGLKKCRLLARASMMNLWPQPSWPRKRNQRVQQPFQ